jgi:UDP:flavonoid glycosyltransferase YjiC (YdhE family)
MSRTLRVFLGVGGVPGHAYPAFALARALVDRGHEVAIETFARWRDVVGELGARYLPGPERIVFPGPAEPGDPDPDFATVVRGLLPVFDEIDPDVVIADLFGTAPAVAAELSGRRRATLVQHSWSEYGAGVPPWSSGCQIPRTRLGTAFWRVAGLAEEVRRYRGKRRGDRARLQLGLPRQRRGGPTLSEELVLVATYPQLEYPRPRPPHVHVTGPMQFELEAADVELPPGDAPLVVVAASMGLDRERGLLSIALASLAGEPVRVLATINERGAEWPGRVPANARVVDWLAYSQVLPEASALITRGGHGTVVRALAHGVPVLACPAGGDQAENAVRLAWAGAGLMLPRPFLSPGPLRQALRRLLADPGLAARAAELAAWSREHDGAERGAELIEETFG